MLSGLELLAVHLKPLPSLLPPHGALHGPVSLDFFLDRAQVRNREVVGGDVQNRDQIVMVEAGGWGDGWWAGDGW